MDQKVWMESLSVSDERILSCLPYMLQDLWSLGGQAGIQIEMVKQLELDFAGILDLGCGKGSSLIQIMKGQAGAALGVDAMAPFIQVARRKAIEWQVEHKAVFRVENLMETLKKEKGYDIVLYGIDSSILGSTVGCVKHLGKALRPNGYAILETCYAGKDALSIAMARENTGRILAAADFRLIQDVVWGETELASWNAATINSIRDRAEELKMKYPQLESVLDGYIEQQVQESTELEQELSCVTLLCQKC